MVRRIDNNGFEYLAELAEENTDETVLYINDNRSEVIKMREFRKRLKGVKKERYKDAARKRAAKSHAKKKQGL